MPDKDRKFTKEDLIEIYKRSDATNEFLANASTSDLLIVKSESAHTHRSPHHFGPVNFDGSTSRFRSATESEVIKQRIGACREAYENAGLIANSVDLMVDFSVESMQIVHENKAIQRFYWQWARQINLPVVVEQMIKSYFVDSNVPVLAFRGRISPGEVRKFRKTTARREGSSSAIKFFTEPDVTRRRIIPYKYAILDVLRLHIEGADLLGNLVFEYDLDIEDKKRLSDPSEQKSDLMLKLRTAIGEKDFLRLVDTGRLHIDPSRVSMIHYKKDGYRRWANPFLWRIIDDLKFKKALRDMDISVIESVINTLTIIGLGDTVGGFPATPEMLTAFAKLLKTNTKSPYLVWNDLIKVIAEYPPVSDILGEEKYEQVNTELRQSLGIPEVILSGAGKGNFANSFIAVKTLVERLESARQAVVRWLESQLLIVAQAMDFRKPASIKLRHMSLSDQEAQKRLMLEMVDRGMISYQTCTEAFGENFEIEVQRMKEEDTFRRKNEAKFPYVLVKTGKFGPSLANGPAPFVGLLDKETLDNRQTDDAELKRKSNKMAADQAELDMKQQKANPPNKLPTQQGSQPQSGGRPSATKKPQKTKTTPRNKPKGQDNSGKPTGNPTGRKAAASNSFEMGQQMFDKLYSAFSKSLIRNLKLKDARHLKDDHKNQIYELVSSVIGEFGSTSEINQGNVEVLLKSLGNQEVNSETLSRSYPKLGTEIRDTVRKIVRDFTFKNGYLPNKSEARDIVASAYAVL